MRRWERGCSHSRSRFLASFLLIHCYSVLRAVKKLIFRAKRSIFEGQLAQILASLVAKCYLAHVLSNAYSSIAPYHRHVGALADEKGQNEGMKVCARGWHWPLKMFPHARALPFLPYSFYTRNPDGTTEQRSPPFSTLPPQRRSGRLIAVREREPAAAAPGEERERPDRAGTDGRTDGQTDRVDSGQTAAVRPLPGEPPLPFPVTEMELINPVYSGNILQRRATDGRR